MTVTEKAIKQYRHELMRHITERPFFDDTDKKIEYALHNIYTQGITPKATQALSHITTDVMSAYYGLSMYRMPCLQSNPDNKILKADHGDKLFHNHFVHVFSSLSQPSEKAKDILHTFNRQYFNHIDYTNHILATYVDRYDGLSSSQSFIDRSTYMNAVDSAFYLMRYDPKFLREGSFDLTDKDGRERFVEKYQPLHRLATYCDDHMNAWNLIYMDTKAYNTMCDRDYANDISMGYDVAHQHFLSIDTPSQYDYVRHFYASLATIDPYYRQFFLDDDKEGYIEDFLGFFDEGIDMDLDHYLGTHYGLGRHRPQHDVADIDLDSSDDLSIEPIY